MEALLNGLGAVITPYHILLLLLGVTLGAVMGCIPGLTGLMAITLLIPVTYYMDLNSALVMLLGIYNGGIYGGSISAILLGTPGAACAGPTVFDGYPMAQKGQAGKALKMALYCSAIGCFSSCLILAGLARPVSRLALYFGPSEYTLLILLALTMVGSVAGDSMIKGLICGFFGILLSTVGMDPLATVSRFSFNNLNLMTGLGNIPVLIGLLALPQILIQVEKIPRERAAGARQTLLPPPSCKDDERVTWRDFKSCIPAISIGAVTGWFFGALPALGATPSAYFSYDTVKKRSKNGHKFGTGEIEGVAAAETGNNATVGSSFVPLLAFGIPGDSNTAVLLGAFLLHGIVIGPNIFNERPDTVGTIYAALMCSNIALVLVMSLLLKYFAKVANAPKSVVFPFVMMSCCIGVYAVSQNPFDVWVLLVFSAVGYLMMKFGFPTTPTLVGFLLGETFERNLRQALLISKNDFSFFFSSKIDWILWIAIAISIVSIARSKRKKQPAHANQPNRQEDEDGV